MVSSLACSNLQYLPMRGIVADNISAATPSLFSLFVNLVMQYLDPSSRNWIVEWTGERGREVISAVVAGALPLSHGPASLVVDYVKKGDIFGLDALEKAAGGKNELTELIGHYNPQQPLPFDIDDEMQKDLSEIWDAETVGSFGTIKKVTEIFSLYWCPAGISAIRVEDLAKKHGQKFHEGGWKRALQDHGKTLEQEGCWIQFPNDVFARSKTFPEQRALARACYEIPKFSHAVFCIFTKYAYTRSRICPSQTYTRCQEQSQGFRLVVGGFSSSGLIIDDGNRDDESLGVAILRKYA